MQIEKTPHLLAIFGIDGSGKSILQKEILKRNAVRTIICPRYHENSNTQYSELSEVLNQMNQLGDDLNCFELKAIAVYFQLTLYQPVLEIEMKRSVSALQYPGAIVSERHPLVDSLIYGPFFAKKLSHPLTTDFIQNKFAPAIERIKPGGLKLFLEWFDLENKRMNRKGNLEEFPLYLKTIFERGPIELLDEIQKHFRCKMPDQAVFLDIDIELALEYIDSRSAYKESHENREGLTRLKEGYTQVFHFFKKARPEMQLSVMKPFKGQSIEALADQVLRLL